MECLTTRATPACYAGYHLFDYDPSASLTLDAGDSVEITGAGAPHGVPSAPGTSVPILFPPTLNVTAGSGGFVLDTDVILFPSPYGNLHITTLNGGNFQSYQDPYDHRKALLPSPCPTVPPRNGLLVPM